jgi:hypothetical protein
MVMTTYLSQSVDMPMGTGTEAPHMSGRLEMAPTSRPLMVLVRLLMHRHATNKATTRTSLFVRASIAHRFSRSPLCQGRCG